MPLVKATLQIALETGFEATLRTEFKKTSTKQSLRQKLDGGQLNGSQSTATDLTKTIDNIKQKTSSVASTAADQLNPADTEALTKKIVTNEWANGIGDSLCEWMSETIAPILAEKMAKVIADQIDIYIKTATIVTPQGPGIIS